MDFSRKNILKKLSNLFYGLAMLFAFTSSYAGVSSHGKGWVELFIFDIAISGCCVLIGFILDFFCETDRQSLLSLFVNLKSKLFLPNYKKIPNFIIHQKHKDINPKLLYYLYALYFFIVLACLLSDKYSFDWTKFIILDFIGPLVLWGVIVVLSKNKIKSHNGFLTNVKNKESAMPQVSIYYTMMWNFEDWAKDKFMTIAPFYDIDKEKIVRACYFVDKYGHRETVRFSDFIGELNPSQIFERKKELHIFQLSNQEYLLSTMNEHLVSDGLYEAFDF